MGYISGALSRDVTPLRMCLLNQMFNFPGETKSIVHDLLPDEKVFFRYEIKRKNICLSLNVT